ncbi:class I SAM-dependent methyltransferase [Kribbella sp. NPDC051586]|uniref:class I SAM-dependent methyltransferase n=1 Tax=Kribbella sp. NPDC051586 TaxID=3364118 RepID=UPI0037903CC8
MRKKVDYDRTQYPTYDQGRALSAEVMRSWMETFTRHAPARRPLTVADVGSGTGRFTPSLAQTFGGPVYGVEPFARMREIAERDATHPAVIYLAGSAERLPLPDDSCDLVLLFLSFHHVQDRSAAARELARVLRPGGRVLLRSSFADRLPDKPWYRYFPRARAIEQEVFPAYSEVVGLFEEAGLREAGFEQVREHYTDSLAEYVERLRHRASSTFEHLTEAEIEAGFTAIEAAARAATTAEPIATDSDLLVLAPN